MRTRTNPKPLGTDPATDFHSQKHERANEELQFYNSGTVKIRHTTRGTIIKAAAARPNGITGLHLVEKIEVDTSTSYDEQTVINIQASHTLCTAGVIDRDSGVLTKANPGQYYSRQSVDAIGSDGQWNVPINPPPVPTNFDDDLNFWIPLGSSTTCPYG